MGLKIIISSARRIKEKNDIINILKRLIDECKVDVDFICDCEDKVTVFVTIGK